MSTIISTNPSRNFEQIGEVTVTTDSEIAEKVRNAHDAKKAWKELEVAGRIEALRGFPKLVQEYKEKIAQRTTAEMGMTITDSQDDVDWNMDYIHWFLENAESALTHEITHEDDNAVHAIHYEPIGVAAVIVPWNYPFGMWLWGVLPNLLAGNCIIVKHSEECPLVGKLLEEMMGELGLPEGVFQAVHGDGSAGQALAESNVDLIWFTGSSAVGQKLYEIGAGKMIKVLLEMGGSNPAILLGDIDVEHIVPRLVSKRLGNCGQSCDALKRLIVHEDIFDDVVSRLKDGFEALHIGDAAEETTQMGPLVAQRQVDRLEEQIADAIDKGATIVTGDEKPEGLEGAYYTPTLIIGVTKDMKIWNEEVFGPVLPVVPFKTEEEAVALAEDTKYGLGAQIYSADQQRAKRIASQLTVGNIDINSCSHWIPCNPFGGCKASGLGREHGIAGLRELCELKQVSMEK